MSVLPTWVLYRGKRRCWRCFTKNPKNDIQIRQFAGMDENLDIVLCKYCYERRMVSLVTERLGEKVSVE